MQRRLWTVIGLVLALSLAVVLSGVVGCSKKEESSVNENTTTDTSMTAPAPGGETTTDTTGMSSGGSNQMANAGESGSGGDPAKGKAIFDSKCSTCHGQTGKGDGPLSASLNPRPRDFHDKAYMSTQSDDKLFHSIKYGKPPMPAWKDQGLSDDDIRNVLAYERTFGK
jgi:mono/diheme cytochrome c family protein